VASSDGRGSSRSQGRFAGRLATSSDGRGSSRSQGRFAGRLATRPSPAPVRSAPPVPAVWASIALAGAGLAVSVYLLIEHFTGASSLACPESDVVNCQRVTTSEQATVLGIPWAAIGTAYFVAMLVLVLPPVWRLEDPRIRLLRVGLAAAGSVSVMYLVFVELFVVDAICLWCTAAHVAALGLFGLIAMLYARE